MCPEVDLEGWLRCLAQPLGRVLAGGMLSTLLLEGTEVPQYLLFSTFPTWEAPGGTSGKEPTCQCRRHKRHRFDPWVVKISWKRAWQPNPVFLPEESHAQRSLVGYSP